MIQDIHGNPVPRFVIVPDGKGWRVKDSVKGVLHSARIADKARAQRQADSLNAKLGGDR